LNNDSLVQDQVAPLHRMKYEDQVHFKALCLKGSLKKLTMRLMTEVPSSLFLSA